MNKSLAIVILVGLFTFGCIASANAAAPKRNNGVDIQGNLALVPDSDPAAANPPVLVEATAGQHPRLLFVADDLEALRTNIEKDPILKKAWEDTYRFASKMNHKKQAKHPIFTGDTAALTTSARQYTSLVYAYALKPSAHLKAQIVSILEMFVEEPHWAYAKELDCNMGAGNNMLTAALLFDVVYNDLDPEFRMKVAKKIHTQARRMYYLGHQQKALDIHKYWQQDPQNNHRWHRNAGMAASLIVLADIPELDTGFLREEHLKELDFIFKWYPHDGDCHEGSGYQDFGFYYLAITAKMVDRNFGTEHLKHPGLTNAWKQQIYYRAPGRKGYMSFGDAKNGEGVLNHLGAAFFLSPALSRDPDIQAVMLKNLEILSVNKKTGRTINYPWSLLTFYDPTVGKGDYRNIPNYCLFADMGALTVRNNWSDNGVLFTFKCGPYGGYRLNEYRHTHLEKDGRPHYVNIAHDDPDANSFALGTAGQFLFHPGNYATDKLTSNHNTIVVDGKGQTGEGEHWMQPTAKVDMRTLSYLTGLKVNDQDQLIVEGEAGPSYKNLDRFRRTAIWMPDDYILLLDHVVAKEKSEIAWLGINEKVELNQKIDARIKATTKAGPYANMQLLATASPVRRSIVPHEMKGRWTKNNLDQVKFAVDAKAVQFATLIDPWRRGFNMTLAKGDGDITLTVRSRTSAADTWTWKTSDDLTTPSAITGKRDGELLIELTADDVAPLGDPPMHE